MLSEIQDALGSVQLAKSGDFTIIIARLEKLYVHRIYWVIFKDCSRQEACWIALDVRY